MDPETPKDGQPDGQPPQQIKIPCPVCKYRKFRSEQGFNDHIQDEHNIFPCHKCDALYACKDDLARHKSETHGKVNHKPKYKKKPSQKQKGKFRPVIRSVSLPASENTSSTQLPTMGPRPQPAQPRPSTAHVRQPSTETRKSPAQIRQSTMQFGQSSAGVHQGDEQGHPAPPQVFHPQHQFRQIRHPLPPRPLNVPRVPIELYQGPSNDFQAPSQGFRPPAQVFQRTGQTLTPPDHTPSPVYQSPLLDHQTENPVYQTHPRRRKNKVQVYRLPLQVPQLPKENYRSPQESWNSQFLNQELQHQESHQAKHAFTWASHSSHYPTRATDPPAQHSNSSEQYSQSPIQDSRQVKEVSHFLQLGSQSLQISQDAHIPQSPEDSKSPEQAIQQAEQVSRSFSRSSQPLELDLPLALSQFPVQVPQEARKLAQCLQKYSPFLVCHWEQTEVSNSSLQLSAHDPITTEANETDRSPTSLPATNPTTPDIFIPPPPTDPTFSLIYGKMPHRWTDLEPLEQTLIIRYLLATCHSAQRLHSQGYNVPRIINTKACMNEGEPHQHHIDPQPTNPNSTHRKAIVLDCAMIETTVCTNELAFITAIDFLTGEVLINSYVSPTAPVTDWLTPVSGITHEKMDAALTEGNVFASNAEARGALRKFLNRDTVLIGHALQHDLRTLSLIHGRIVDTSVITSEAVFPSVSAKITLPRVWGLDTLAEELVGIKMRGGVEGHNSLEDALATREIVIWCLRGPDCLKDWAEKTRDSLARMRNRRGARRNRGIEGGGADANNGQEEERTAE
ncbi:Polynucleotidyl transferase, ribonuclease H fold [Penicillium camemberti]|uniref:Polynucleotidyl transferase, ribonuclease H fold n=1 Tax=Penicillium camemberti (strain FM 013) TaxID=1429867 RepID=A0A0G4P2Y9_PENC3|nr:Polynucleotidyl transferase, ribonuclease H fold [Penicillium camemberti]